jgi:hypothetical protein
MGEIVSLRRARKAKARVEVALQADANRAKHGVPKRERARAKADKTKQQDLLQGHRLRDSDA